MMLLKFRLYNHVVSMITQKECYKQQNVFVTCSSFDSGLNDLLFLTAVDALEVCLLLAWLWKVARL